MGKQSKPALESLVLRASKASTHWRVRYFGQAKQAHIGKLGIMGKQSKPACGKLASPHWPALGSLVLWARQASPYWEAWYYGKAKQACMWEASKSTLARTGKLGIMGKKSKPILGRGTEFFVFPCMPVLGCMLVYVTVRLCI